MSRVNLLLLVLVIGAALAAVTSQHQARKLFIDLEREQQAAQKLDEEFTQLTLEQGTWGTHKRVESVATRQLGMRAPDPSTTVILTLEGPATGAPRR